MTQAFNLALHANFIDASGKVSASGLQAGAIPAAFPTATVMLFVQTSAPTGWVKSTEHNNKALRVVSGTAGSGGSIGFTTAFDYQPVSGTNGSVGDTTLTIAQIPSHTHTITLPTDVDEGFGGFFAAGGDVRNETNTTDARGGGGSHTHTASAFTGTAINLDVFYVDVIICTKS